MTNKSIKQRIIHIFKSKAQVWTRCDGRVLRTEVISFTEAQDEFYWRSDGALFGTVICVNCAKRK